MAEDQDYFGISLVDGAGHLIQQITPFQPNVEISYADNGSAEHFDVTFNQGYIFNSVSNNLTRFSLSPSPNPE